MQTRLVQKSKVKTTYDYPQVNEIVGVRQRIETSRGCPNNCPYCYEPTKMEVFPLPAIERNYVEILDMNFLCQPNVVYRIRELGMRKVKEKVVYYEEIGGFDYRIMTQEIADALKKARFIKLRFAWDLGLQEQYKIKDCLNMFLNAGYRPKQISIFVLVNWKISKKDCEKKLDLFKVWNVKVNDCCYDGGYKQAIPETWTAEELKDFRAKCRKHNQLVNFGIDPELNPKDIKVKDV